MIGWTILFAWLAVSISIVIVGKRCDSPLIMGAGAAMFCLVAMVDKVNW